MKILIFEPTLSGHHLEYLHHYYEGALNRSENDYVFMVPRKFEQFKELYEWPFSSNIDIRYIDEKYDGDLSVSNIYILGWKTSKILRDYVREIKPDKVILTTIMQFIPFICWLLPNSVKVRGIMYKIYLYEKNRMSFFRLLAERFRFWVAARSAIIESIYVLNDEDSSEEFNAIYHTDKFKFIPDPVLEIDITKCSNIRNELSIPKEHKVYLHFGAMGERKGTLEILKAIELSDKTDLNNATFIFAGKIDKSIIDEVYSLQDRIKNRVHILMFDQFCSYEFLFNLCFTCDVILMPYKLTSLSSGVVGYAAVFNKPVIGPSDGLIGSLIRKFNLGYCLQQITAAEISKAFSTDISVLENNYIKKNSLSSFINIILE